MSNQKELDQIMEKHDLRRSTAAIALCMHESLDECIKALVIHEHSVGFRDAIKKVIEIIDKTCDEEMVTEDLNNVRVQEIVAKIRNGVLALKGEQG